MDYENLSDKELIELFKSNVDFSFKKDGLLYCLLEKGLLKISVNEEDSPKATEALVGFVKRVNDFKDV